MMIAAGHMKRFISAVESVEEGQWLARDKTLRLRVLEVMQGRKENRATPKMGVGPVERVNRRPPLMR